MLELLNFVSLDWLGNPTFFEGMLIVALTMTVIFALVGLLTFPRLKERYLALDIYGAKYLFSNQDAVMMQ